MNDYLKSVKSFCDILKKTFKCLKDNMKEITKIIVINNVKERKEFYYLMQVLMFVEDEKSFKKYSYLYHESHNSILLPKREELRKKMQEYFLKEQNEDGKEILSVYNYYYTIFIQIGTIYLSKPFYFLEQILIILSGSNRGFL